MTVKKSGDVVLYAAGLTDIPRMGVFEDVSKGGSEGRGRYKDTQTSKNNFSLNSKTPAGPQGYRLHGQRLIDISVLA